MNKRLPAFFYSILIFCCLQTAFAQDAFQQPDQLEAHIRRLQQTVQNGRLTTALLSRNEAQVLPVGLLSNTGDKPAILIDEINFYPEYAEFKAYAAVQLPGAKDDIYFATPQPVRFSFKGGLMDVARMALVNSKRIKMPGGMDFTIQKNRTYLDFDCYGFLKAGLAIEAELNQKLVPEKPNGTQDASGRVKARFYTEFTDLNNIIAAASIDAFQVKGIQGLTFTSTDAVIDMSDYGNIPNITFPAGYLENYYPGTDANLWRGFYIRNLSVKLPPEIEDRSGSGRKEFGAFNLMIDHYGISGQINAKNLISLQNGNLAGWSYSLDSIAIGFVANQLTGASMAGGINIPIAKEDQKLNYTAIFNPGKEYIFTIAAANELQFDLFKASRVRLHAGSAVQVALVNNKFEATANLSGQMDIGASLIDDAQEQNEANRLALTSLRFEQLIVSTKHPYLLNGTFDLSMPVKMGRYNANIQKIYLAKAKDKHGLGMDMKIGLLNEKDAANNFSADASLEIVGEISSTQSGRQRYRHTGTNFSRISLDIDQGSFALKGGLMFFKEDATFGAGFRGDIAASIRKPEITLAATALFGNVKGVKYWYADAFAGFDKGIRVTPMMNITGFAGGLYYGVKQKEGNGGPVAIVNTQTGLSYLPDASAGLGLKAAVQFGITGNDKICNGNVGFELAFYRGGGLSRVAFMGNVNFMEQANKEVSVLRSGSVAFSKINSAGISSSDKVLNTSAFDQINRKGALAASILIDYDIENNQLFANFESFVNVGGGSLKGVNTKGAAGRGMLYFAPHTWQVLIGTPENPIGIRVAGLADINSYFMAGNDLPGSPPPPANVGRILGIPGMDYMRDLNRLQSGKGFAFGASTAFDTGNKRFLIFSGRFAVGAGFDVMLKDYGTQAMCDGRNGPIGINGWYANGQVYAFVEGRIGLECKLFGKERKFDIIDVGAATVLQAKLPNPVWLHGIVGGRYSVMGGLIKGQCRFELTVGEECKITDTDAFAQSDVRVIADVTPANSEKDVDVFAIPQAVFNIPMGETFSIKDAAGQNYQFRAKLDNFGLSDAGSAVAGIAEWNADRTVLVLNTAEILPPQKELSVLVKISFEENRNGTWKPYTVNGKTYFEEKICRFKTGTAPDYIPPSNIAYSYPINGQLNYYKNETKNAYIKLKRSQAYLFQDQSFKPVARLLAEDGTTKEATITYRDNRIDFAMPEVANSVGHSLQLVLSPASQAPVVEANVKTTEETLFSANESDATVRTRTAEGNIKSLQEKLLFSMQFRSSKYSSLAQKISAGINSYSFNYFYENKNLLGYAFDSDEVWDEFENGDAANLIRVEADMKTNNWYSTYVYAYVYQAYPELPNLRPTWRELNEFGLPPLKAIYTLNNHNLANLRYPVLSKAPAGKIGFEYQVAHYMEMDFLDVQGKIASGIAYGSLKTISERMKQLVQLPFQPVLKGNYKMIVRYVLPGTETVASSNEVNIINTIGK